MFGPLSTVVAVVLGAWLILPALDVSVGGYTAQMDHPIALFLGGLAGGARFVFLRSRPMGTRETLSLTVMSYLLVTLIPLLLLAAMVFVARDVPEVADLLSGNVALSDVVTFAVAYITVDALPGLTALLLAFTIVRLGAANQ